jgi:hypothetical protein
MRDYLRPAPDTCIKNSSAHQVHGTLWWEYFNACAQALDLLDWINLHNKASSWDCAGQTYLMQFSRQRRQRQSIENFLTMRPRAVAGFVVFVCSFFTREWILCEFPEISQPASRSAAAAAAAIGHADPAFKLPNVSINRTHQQRVSLLIWISALCAALEKIVQSSWRSRTKAPAAVPIESRDMVRRFNGMLIRY